MTAMGRTTELLEHERRFWNAMRDKDGEAASEMTADNCIVVGAQGVSAIDPKTMARLTKEGEWELERYTFDESPSLEEVGLFDVERSVTVYEEIPEEDRLPEYPPPDL